jgi:dTDP-glucose 4,6-dehydratase
MRILITGCRGTLGLPLMEYLREAGHEVYGLDLQHWHDDYYYRADISEFRQVEQVFGDVMPDTVYHLAAEFGRHNGEDYYEQLWKTNAIGTKNVLKMCDTLDMNLIFASSSEIYGEPSEESYDVNLGIPEHMTDAHPTYPGNDYAISKWVNELQIRNHIRAGQKIMTLRFFNAYGPGEYYHPYRSVVCLFCYSLLNGMPIKVFEGYHRVFMYIDDFTPTLARACEHFESGSVTNIGGTEYRSVEELAEICLAETDAPPTLVDFLSRDKHNVVNKRPDISRARDRFGHNPTICLEEGVKKTVEWMRSVYDFPAP